MERFFESYSDSSSDDEVNIHSEEPRQDPLLADQIISNTNELNPHNDSGKDLTKDTKKERFKALQDRRRQLTEKSTKRRIRQFQKDAIEKVLHECKGEEEISAIIQDDLKNKNIRREEKDETQSVCSEVTPRPEATTSKWEDLKPHLNEFEHLKGLDRGKHAPKTKLALTIDKALSLGQVETAEKLSDHWANRDFAQKIVNAFDAKTFVQKQKEEAETRKRRGKRKLPWTFENKHRWETKSNM